MFSSFISPRLSFINRFFSDFPIKDWPVSISNRPFLNNVKSSHVVRRIPAFDIRNEAISPSDYQDKLAGSIVQVCFALVHYHIRQSQKNIFNAMIRELTVLRPPLHIVSSTLTQLRSVFHSHKKEKTHA
jgi:hypothetical protein